MIQKYFGRIPGVPNTKIYRESLKLAEKINILDFQKMAYQKLKEHKLKCSKKFLSYKIPYELKY